jgi:hypothetical protein
MGSAYSTLASDVYGLYFNPAGLGNMSSREIAGMYGKDYLETKYITAAFALPLSDWGGVAAGWSRLANTFEATDTNGTILGNQDVSNDVFLLGASYYQSLPFSLGVTAKFIREKIGDFSLSGIAADAGVLCDLEPFSLALVGRNIVTTGLKGDSVAGGSVTEDIQPDYVAGLSFTGSTSLGMPEPATLPGAADAKDADRLRHDALSIRYTIAVDVLAREGKTDQLEVNPGMEVWVNNLICFRTGVRNTRDYTAGMSLSFGKMRFDYAFLLGNQVDNSHLFSTSISF